MYYIIKFLRKVLLRSPIVVSLFLGRFLGFVFYLNQKKRRVAFRNIKAALPQKEDREIKAIIKRNCQNFGLTIMEFLIYRRLLKYTEVKGWENLSEEGGIFTGIHSGGWEIYNFALVQKIKFAVLAKRQKITSLDKFINEIREEAGLKVAFSLKDMVRFLRMNFILGLVVDHGAESKASFIEFFSHFVPTPSGAVYIAKKFHKKIYPCFGYRRKNFSHVIEIGKPITPNGRDHQEILREINHVYENYIIAHPWEYFWYFKRFKRKKNLEVVILSDGKPGHLKQSQALVSFLKEGNSFVRSKVIEVKSVNRLVRLGLDICALFTTKQCVGCGMCLDILLTREVVRNLKHIYADIIISTGSSVASVNKIVSAYLGAKSVIMMKPNTSLSKYDVVIIPEHDRVSVPNVVNIKGALVYPLGSEEKTQQCKSHFRLTNERKIACFIGGSLTERHDFINNLKIFIEKLKEFSLNKDYKIIISTSRRTPQESEEYLEKELGSFPNTEVIVYANRLNYDFVFEGFCALAEMVFVTSESISMISEIMAFKKPCICVLLEKQSNKHQLFLESVEKEVSFLVKPYNIAEVKPKIPLVFEENKVKIKEAMQKLL